MTTKLSLLLSTAVRIREEGGPGAWKQQAHAVWAELKLTNIRDVAIPLVKMCLPLEEKRAGWKKRMSFQVFTFPVYIAFRLACFYYCHVVG